jgi:hypothetical protein
VVPVGGAPARYGGPTDARLHRHCRELIVSREPPAEPGENEIAVASLDELRAARLSGKRLLALWNGLPAPTG